MNRTEVLRKLFDPQWPTRAAVVWYLLGLVVLMFLVTGAIFWWLRGSGRLEAQRADELSTRWRSWIWIASGLALPILLGPAWVICGALVLGLLCFNEFARATGVFREKTVCVFVVLGMLAVAFAAFDNYSRLFFATAALVTGLICVSTIPLDQPKGYVQRTGLGVMGFLLFGYSFGYLGFLSNSPHYASMLVGILLCVEANDLFAYWIGSTVRGPAILPNTSPSKTWSGAIGALVFTTMLTIGVMHLVFQGTPLDRWQPLLILGIGISILGQLGDLLLSSIKRDAGIHNIGHMIPAHGGLLDRFDSLVLIPPAAFHFISLYLGAIGADQPQRILSGG
ncbi:MAG: phosphatidate cytidylyltransferase [Pirellulales bacterium]